MNKLAFGFYINNYPGINNDLNGCLNDGYDMKKKLTRKGFDCKFLFDKQATTSAITSGIKDLLSIAQPKDSVFFGNSSHGTYEFRPTTEADKTDEGFCSIADTGDRIDVIWDDTIWGLFRDFKKPGVQAVWFSDSCFGGGAMRLIGPQAKGTPRFISLKTILQSNPQATKHPIREISFVEDKSPWPFLWLAGSLETEPCYDASYGGRPNGAFTYTALKVLDTTPAGLTYAQWFAAYSKLLPTQDYPQHPLMMGSYQNAKIFS